MHPQGPAWLSVVGCVTARHHVGSSPAAAAALLRAGWDRGIDLPSVGTRMKWSILHPAPPWLPCGLGSSLCSKWHCWGWQGQEPCSSLLLLCPLGCPPLAPALARATGMVPVTQSSSQVQALRQKSAPSSAGINCIGCGGDRQAGHSSGFKASDTVTARSRGWGAAAVGLDTCGLHRLSRLWQGMAQPFLPPHRAPGKAGNFPKYFFVLGFPSWLLE